MSAGRMIERRAGLVVAAAALFACGCTQLLDFSECDTNADCPNDLTCSAHVCSDKPVVKVTANVDKDTTWTADKVYELKNLVTVNPSVKLTIEAGTKIIGDHSSALVVRSGGLLDAQGTREKPILFTSAKPVGQRQPGDWGGVALIGKAPVNRKNFSLNILTNNASAPVGGPDPTWNCGAMKYVRIEFAGGQVNGVEALNGLTLAGCGSDTKIDHIDVHFGGDDAIEIFGGTVSLKYIVITRPQDDGLDIDTGWRGTAQYVAILQDSGADNGFEVDNLQEDETATPQTNFKISNFTVIGPGDMGLTRGITMKAGAEGYFTHGIIVGSTLEAIDVVGDVAGQHAKDGDITLRDTLFYKIGDGGEHYFPVTGEMGETDGMNMGAMDQGDDGGFDEDSYYRQAMWNNVFGIDPGIDNLRNYEKPGWVPSGDHIVDVDRPPDNFDPLGVYRGAFSPNEVPWTEGWTAAPGG